jgi:hypothetical protein
MRNQKQFFVCLLCIFLFCLSTIPSQAKIINSTADYNDVAAKVAAADPGDTILISGSATWASTLTITRSVTLKGQGADHTKITYGGVTPLIKISLSSDVPVRITGIYFDLLNNNINNRTAINVWGNKTGSYCVRQIRIDHNTVNKGVPGIEWDYWAYGVIDHNTLINGNINILVVGDGHEWERPIIPGTTNAVFIEDNIFITNNDADREPNEPIYQQGGAKSVTRYNLFDCSTYTNGNSFFYDSHGNWWGSHNGYGDDGIRGQPILEIYKNTFKGHHSYGVILKPRGGSVLFWDNTIIFVQPGSHNNIAFVDEESWQTLFFTPIRKVWPAQDQINNTFIWNNTRNGIPITDIYVTQTDLDNGATTFFQEGRDYWMHEPQATGGRTIYTGARQGGSTAPPTEDDTGNTVFISTGPNAYYPYIPFQYPHPLSVEGETGRLLNLQAAPNGSSLVLSWQPINGAATYSIVRDWQEASAVIVTGTNWSDTALSGEHVYMVYALDNTGKVLAAEGKIEANQILNLAAGWNWISFNVLPADLSLNSVLSGILDKIEQVKTQTQSAIRSGNTWKGDLADMSGIGQHKMYKVKVNAACTLAVTGTAISSATPIPLSGGWNWVAYLPTTAMSITTALDSIEGQVMQIKSLTQTATFNGTTWSGAFDMQPGQGYAIKMNAPGTLIYPAAASVKINQQRRKQ